MQLVFVAHVPCPGALSIIVGHRLDWVCVSRLLGVEGVAMLVLGRTHFTRSLGCIDLKDSIVGTINIGIDPQAEKMLMIVRIDTWVDFGTPTLRVLAWIHCVGVQNSSKLDLELNRTILVEDPVDTVFVISCCEDLGDDQFPGACDNDRVVSEIQMLE